MKRIISIFSLLVLVTLSACKDDEDVSPEQAFLNKLEGTWTISSDGVYVDGTEISDQYTNFSITFNSDPSFKVYEVENGGEAFTQKTDSYEFITSNFDLVQRNSDGITMQMIVGDKKLKIMFTKLPANSGGRVDGTYGEFEFNLIQQ